MKIIQNLSLMILASFLSFSQVACGKKASDPSFSLDGLWVMDIEASRKQKSLKFPPLTPPAGGPLVYLKCNGEKCSANGLLLKVREVHPMIRLSGQDDVGLEKRFPSHNFAKHPEIEYRLKIINDDTIEHVRVDGSTIFVLNRLEKK